jgi:hypothetical protein
VFLVLWSLDRMGGENKRKEEEEGKINKMGEML